MRNYYLIFLIVLSVSCSFSQDVRYSSQYEVNNFSLDAQMGDSVKSPVKAVVMSAVLPGLGQYYNESYWKIPIIYGLGAFFVYEYMDYNKDFKNYADKFEASKTIDNPYGSTYLKNYREDYRDKRDSFIWYGGFLYLINILDAFVDSHLYGFDVDENLSVGFKPGISNNAFFIKIRF